MDKKMKIFLGLLLVALVSSQFGELRHNYLSKQKQQKCAKNREEKF